MRVWKRKRKWKKTDVESPEIWTKEKTAVVSLIENPLKDANCAGLKCSIRLSNTTLKGLFQTHPKPFPTEKVSKVRENINPEFQISDSRKGMAAISPDF